MWTQFKTVAQVAAPTNELTITQFEGAANQMGVNPPAGQTFANADADGNGKITEQEFVAFHTAASSSSPSTGSPSTPPQCPTITDMS